MRRGQAVRLLVAQPLEPLMQASRSKGQSRWAGLWSAAQQQWWQWWRGQLCSGYKGQETRQQLRSHLQQMQKSIRWEQLRSIQRAWWKWIHQEWSKSIRKDLWSFLKQFLMGLQYWCHCFQMCYRSNQSQTPMKYCHFLLSLQQIRKWLNQKRQQMFHQQEACQCLLMLLLFQLGRLGHQQSHRRSFLKQIHFLLILQSLPSRTAGPKSATLERSNLQQSTSRDGTVQFPYEDRYQGPTSQQAGQPGCFPCIWLSQFRH